MQNTSWFLITVFIGGLCSSASGQNVQFDGELDLPRVIRFHNLPMRMVSEVSVPEGKATDVLDPAMIGYFDNLLRTSTDTELQANAATGLARIARGKHGDISGSVDALRKLLTSENRTVHRAAVMALIESKQLDAAGDLLNASQTGNDRLRQIIDPALATWSFAPAAKVWLARLKDPQASGVSLTLAAQGLAALEHGEATDAVKALAANDNASFQSRQAASAALAVLNPGMARELAASFQSGDLRLRLLAVNLLNTADGDSPQQLLALCDDPEHAVAANAWTQLQRLRPELLKTHVKQGHAHADSGVRLAAIQVMSNFPAPEHSDFLNRLAGDIHIDVRNNARAVLLSYANANAELREKIVNNAATAVEANDSWQRTEQSLHIAAALSEAKFSKMCVPLLNDNRAELFVTAGWFIHLFPDPLIMDEVTSIAESRVGLVQEPIVGSQTSDQLAYLMQAAGYVEHKPLEALCEKQLNKSSPLNRNGRAAGIWALGMLNRDTPDSPLAGKLVTRLNDRDALQPEFDLVRRMAVMSLGRLKAKSQVDQVLNAYKEDTPASLIPESARWALEELGETDIPPIRLIRDKQTPVGGWSVYPLKSQANK